MRTRIYNLKTVNGETILNMGLGLLVSNETNSHITINLPTGKVVLNKYEYVNKDKVYEAGDKLFFILCTKNVTLKHAKNVLINHALTILHERRFNLDNMIAKFEKEIIAA